MVERCMYINSKGKQCEQAALVRLYISADHPFDFVDTCAEHRKEYQYFGSVLNLETREFEV